MSVNAHIILLSQYVDMDSAYWGLGFSTSGIIYLALCTHQPGKTAAFFTYNPKTGKLNKLFSLIDHIEVANTSIQQGKIHTPIFEGQDGLCYFGTHFAYPYGKPQTVTYEGGHLVSYDLTKNKVNDLGIALPKEGILSLLMDRERMFMYMLTAPSFNFITYDIYNKKYTNYGRVTDKGSICRSLVIDDDGNVYGSFEKDRIFQFNQSKSSLEYLSVALSLRKEKIQEWKGKSRGGVNRIGRNLWRSALWNNTTKLIYGIHAGQSTLFAFNPKSEKVQELVFMGADTDKNHPEMIYPTLSLAQYRDVLFYAPASGFFDYARSEAIKKHTHLISYDILKLKRLDYGEIRGEGNRGVYGVAGSIIDNQGKYFLLGAVEVLPNERYNKQNVFQGKPFHLGLIEIDINKFI